MVMIHCVAGAPQVHGYFNQPIPVVGHLPDPINYWKVSSEGEWRLLLAKKYKELGVSQRAVPPASPGRGPWAERVPRGTSPVCRATRALAWAPRRRRG